MTSGEASTALWKNMVKAAAGLQECRAGRSFRLERVDLHDLEKLPPWAIRLRELVIECEEDPAGEPQVERAGSDDSLLLDLLCERLVQPAIYRLERACPKKALRRLSPVAQGKLHIALVSRLQSLIGPVVRASDAKRKGSTRKFLLEVFARYPVLGRLTVTAIRDWERASEEFLRRLNRDWKALLRAQRAGAPTLRHVVDLDSDLADLHHGGRTVLALHFPGGFSWIYKPRPCHGEKEWGRLLRGLDNSPIGLYHPKVLVRRDYGWMEYVRPKPCRSAASARSFYRRAGAVLCAAQLVRAVDLHRENLIAAGAHPVVVDLESLWHPSTRSTQKRSELPPAIWSGLLPRKSRERKVVSHALDSAPSVTAPCRHRPRIGDRYLQANCFVPAIEQGFREAARLFCETPLGRRRCRAILTRIASQQWRRILRPTSLYAQWRERSLQPALLKSGLKRDRAILRCCRIAGTPEMIAAAEAHALSRLDIPLFRSAPTPLPIIPPPAPSSSALLAALPYIRRALQGAG